MKGILFGVCACAMLSASAATVEVTGVRQLWPWSGKVEISYAVAGGADEHCDVALTVKCGGRDVSARLPFLAQDQLTYKSSGSYRFVFDPAWLPSDATSDQLSFTLDAMPSMGGKYMIVDISNPAAYTVSYANDIPAEALTEEKSPGMDSNVYRETKIVLRRIHPGVFTMGSPVTETGHPTAQSGASYQENQFQVTLTNEFWIGVFPMSYGQYTRVCPTSAGCRAIPAVERTEDGQGFAMGLNYVDIVGVNSAYCWPDSTDVDTTQDVCFLGRLRNRTAGQLPQGFVFSLPSEAQWEYACRAGTTTAFNDGSDCVLEEDGVTCLALDKLGYYKTAGSWYRIARFPPNAWGLYDMHGGVMEIVHDHCFWGGDDRTWDKVEPRGWDLVPTRGGDVSYCYSVVRGGWATCGTAIYCRSAWRKTYGALADATSSWAGCGFRLAVIRAVKGGINQ